ncbi:hypothetical protein GBA65_13655 [Rubrobacter marinus]|uniref:Uncharacterized protein n=1 Tax=Rubrobacter marinus TaxID=2653852 RepID=A0A6G8PYQ8_9ACTN|nr:hypothetical protein [Rubrobacter marinus]QIN79384.1 hypothetical protein GBA65_13655 [Rubrobacter marinus]
MGKLRVLMTNEPRSYREAIALALETARPQADVLTAGPGALDPEVRRFAPRLVICSRVTAFVQAEVPVWVELYPDHGPDSIVSFAGQRSRIPGMELDDLIRIFDRTRAFSLGAV